jgi:Protein of unknown function (DUF3014)
MPEDQDPFHDLDLEPTRRPGETDLDVSPYRPEPPPRRGGGLLFPVTLVSVALVAIGLLAILFLVFRRPSAPTAVTVPSLPAARPAPAPSATPAVALPALDQSDDFVRQVASGLSSHPEIAQWLARTALVRTLTVVVSNIADGETPRPHLDFLAPKQRFHAAHRPGRTIVPDPASFRGYNAFADAVASVDATAAAGAFFTLEPLFDAAYRDLGHPEGGFRGALDRAIRALLAVPVLDANVELAPHAVGFRYADPKLEALTAAQKQFLRTGPRNVRLVQGKLRELETALRSSSSAAPATSR